MAIVVIGDLYGLVGLRDALLALLVDTQARVREQPGCMTYTFGEVVGEPGRVVVCEEWRDPQALEAHYRSAAFVEYQQRVGEFLARPSDVRIHHVSETIRPE